MSVNQVAILRVFPGKLMERNRKKQTSKQHFQQNFTRKKKSTVLQLYAFSTLGEIHWKLVIVMGQCKHRMLEDFKEQVDFMYLQKIIASKVSCVK